MAFLIVGLTAVKKMIHVFISVSPRHPIFFGKIQANLMFIKLVIAFALSMTRFFMILE